MWDATVLIYAFMPTLDLAFMYLQQMLTSELRVSQFGTWITRLILVVGKVAQLCLSEQYCDIYTLKSLTRCIFAAYEKLQGRYQISYIAFFQRFPLHTIILFLYSDSRFE
jgi:hypothetical protein